MPDDLDWFAIKLVVREGIRTIPLSRDEKVMAAHLMRAKNIDSIEAGVILGVSTSVVTKRLWGVDPPMPVWWVQQNHPEVIGNLRPKRPNMSKQALRAG